LPTLGTVFWRGIDTHTEKKKGLAKQNLLKRVQEFLRVLSEAKRPEEIGQRRRKKKKKLAEKKE